MYKYINKDMEKLKSDLEVVFGTGHIVMVDEMLRCLENICIKKGEEYLKRDGGKEYADRWKAKSKVLFGASNLWYTVTDEFRAAVKVLSRGKGGIKAITSF